MSNIRGRYDDKIERLGPVAMDNPIVRHCVRAVEAGYLPWDEAMTQAVKALAEQNKVLTDNAIQIAMVTPSPGHIVVESLLSELA